LKKNVETIQESIKPEIIKKNFKWWI